MEIRRIGLVALLLAIVLLAVLPVPEFWITQLNFIGIATIAVLGLILLTGVGGLTSFGQAAFVGLGAYTTAVLSTTFGVSPWFTLGIGLAITAVVALLVGYLTLRLSGHYLPLSTIAWAITSNSESRPSLSGTSTRPPPRA